MPQIIKNGVVVDDGWQLIENIENGQTAPDSIEANSLIPLSMWLAEDKLSRRNDIGVWLKSDDGVASLVDYMPNLPIIAIHFPTFTDGRGFSNARLLRERYGYMGEIRAIGYVLRDQLCYLKRCGFNAFVLQPDVDLSAALVSLNDFSESYQASADQQKPLFRRRA